MKVIRQKLPKAYFYKACMKYYISTTEGESAIGDRKKLRREGDEKCIQFFFFGNPARKKHLGDLGVDGRITLKRPLGKLSVTMWTGCNWLRSSELL
jgi:hypothetical protein